MNFLNFSDYPYLAPKVVQTFGCVVFILSRRNVLFFLTLEVGGTLPTFTGFFPFIPFIPFITHCMFGQSYSKFSLSARSLPDTVQIAERSKMHKIIPPLEELTVQHGERNASNL